MSKRAERVQSTTPKTLYRALSDPEGQDASKLWEKAADHLRAGCEAEKCHQDPTRHALAMYRALKALRALGEQAGLRAVWNSHKGQQRRHTGMFPRPLAKRHPPGDHPARIVSSPVGSELGARS